MNKKLEEYRRYLFIGIIVLVLGILFSITMTETVGALGFVFIVIGGILFFIAMNLRKDAVK